MQKLPVFQLFQLLSKTAFKFKQLYHTPYSLIISLALLLGLTVSAAAENDIPVYHPQVINQLPHDSDAFVQGLISIDGQFYEGTGRLGQSSLRLVEQDSGKVLKYKGLREDYFGEGITLFGDKIYQLTWRSHIGLIYNKDTFQQIGSFYLIGEGWGLTHDNENLIVSDGTSYIRFLDPDRQQEVRRIQVTQNGLAIDRLNELEYINGEIWANVWYQDYILIINPETGEVTGQVDLQDLYQPRSSSDAVLNGIAWDETQQRLFVTGKLWPAIYEIKIPEKSL